MSTPLEQGMVVAGRYRVERCLEVGGMGGIYEVLDTQTDRFCALKAMLPAAASDKDLQERFEQEAVVAGRIKSEHVVSVTDSGVIEATGARFIVMELLEGEDLGAALRREGRLDADTVIAYLTQVARGLDKIHAQAVVHRDLKPDNVFLCARDDGSALLKIIDFGIAKNVAGLATLATTRALGTPLYMAPEQLTGDATIDARADLYSLAQMAYTLLVGTPYWHEEAKNAPSAHAFCTKVIAGVVQPATERARQQDLELPEAFDAWFMKAAATTVDDRFESAELQVEALAGALALAPLASRALAREPRRGRAVAIGFAGIAVAATLVVTWRLTVATPAVDVATPHLSSDVEAMTKVAPVAATTATTTTATTTVTTTTVTTTSSASSDAVAPPPPPRPTTPPSPTVAPSSAPTPPHDPLDDL
jgi:serine/threonine-protein kinase